MTIVETILGTVNGLLPSATEFGSVVLHTAADEPVAMQPGQWYALLVPLLPIVGVVLVTLTALLGIRSKLPAWISVACLGGAFIATLVMYLNLDQGRYVTFGFRWIDLAIGNGKNFTADFGLYIDSLTCLWMLFVTGLATLIALYASEYMSHDVGPNYARFFVAFNLFVFSMACLVMADNLVLMFLGWEGVGLCSYLLIGYYFKKPAAVAASKKAFVVNRIGDLGLLMGIFLTYTQFETVQYAELFVKIQPYVDMVQQGRAWDVPMLVGLIPVLFMVGALGKSAQLPLYVWLPVAMEGPTPVSALIHAATMVTAGVYLIARTYAFFVVSPIALPIVAWVGAATALLSATIGMAQFDIKRIMAYSTVSQLGYMFCGLAFLTSAGAAFHVLTHAFFKASLFLACGAVMHGFAGQLDLRKLSGVAFMKGWGIVALAMFVGCLNLAGFPFTAGYFSKDMILAEAFVTAGPGYRAIGWVLLATAGLTAYYTFRVFFRVFVGPQHAEPGDELHAHDDNAGHADHAGHDHAGHAEPAGLGAAHSTPAAAQPSGEEHAHDAGQHGDHHHDHFHPHAPGWAINLVLFVLTLGSLGAAGLYFVGEHHGWVGGMIHDSSAYTPAGVAAFLEPAHAGEGHSGDDHSGDSHAGGSHATLFGQDPHKIMYYVSAVIGLIGILTAAYLHGPKGIQGLFIGSRTKAATSRADGLADAMMPIPKWARGKWYVDEAYDAIIVKPLRALSHTFHIFDRLVIDGLVNLVGFLPRMIANALRPLQSGLMHGYAAGMAVGLAVIGVAVWLLITATTTGIGGGGTP